MLRYTARAICYGTRLLVAQAVAEGCTIATPDPLIRLYPVSTIW
jgi:PIN domain nuclease of toxin-antitoxin system